MNENLEILENDPRARIFYRQIGEVRDNIKRLQRSTAKLSHTVTGILKLKGAILVSSNEGKIVKSTSPTLFLTRRT